MSFPKYSFSDEMAAPSDLGIRREASASAVIDSITGVNYYVDSMAFGQPTGLSLQQGGAFVRNQRPLGIQFFVNTGLQCSNGASMSEYVSTIPKGDALEPSVQNLLRKGGLPPMRGLGPGILEDVKDTLNPQRLFTQLQSTSFAACKKVRLPVGDSKGQIRSSEDPSNVWIEGSVQWVNGQPTQERWIFDRWISKEAWNAHPKTEAPQIFPRVIEKQREVHGVTECFTTQTHVSQLYAGILLAVTAFGILYYTKIK